MMMIFSKIFLKPLRNYIAQIERIHFKCLCPVAASKRRGATRGKGLQDGRPGRLSSCCVRHHEAVLDFGAGDAAHLRNAAREPSAHPRQRALSVRARTQGLTY